MRTLASHFKGYWAYYGVVYGLSAAFSAVIIALWDGRFPVKLDFPWKLLPFVPLELWQGLALFGGGAIWVYSLGVIHQARAADRTDRHYALRQLAQWGIAFAAVIFCFWVAERSALVAGLLRRAVGIIVLLLEGLGVGDGNAFIGSILLVPVLLLIAFRFICCDWVCRSVVRAASRFHARQPALYSE